MYKTTFHYLALSLLKLNNMNVNTILKKFQNFRLKCIIDQDIFVYCMSVEVLHLLIY